MTCTCSINSAFRWREWTEPSRLAAGFARSAQSSEQSSGHIDNERARGVDLSFIGGIGKSMPARDVRAFSIRRSKA